MADLTCNIHGKSENNFRKLFATLLINYKSTEMQRNVWFSRFIVKLDNNNALTTELYQKPMSKRVYLHAFSDHQLHLNNLLFYSQDFKSHPPMHRVY